MPFVLEDETPKARFVLEDDVEQPQTGKETSFGTRFVQGLKDPIDGAAQLLYNALPSGLTSAVDALSNKSGLFPQMPKGGMNELLNQQQKNYKAPDGVDWARLGGNILSPANLAVASKVPQGATMLGRIASGAGVGASMGAITPVSGDGDFATEKAKQIGISSGLGGILPAVTGGIGRVVSPKASTNPQINMLKQQGVNPTVGQTLGGIPNKIEEKMTSLPLMGDMISRARNSTNAEFEHAAFNRALNPIGKSLPKNMRGHDAVVYAESALKDKYDDVLTKIGAIKPDDAFNQKVGSLERMVDNLVMPASEKSKFANALNNVQQSLDENGVITSSAFKKLESDLGTKARKLEGSQNIYEFDLAPAVKQLQSELRDMLKRQAGGLSDELQKANTGWANFKRVQNAAAKLGAENGEFTPSQFQNSVRALDRTKDKSAFARGGALGQDLGSAGKAILGNKVPSSGTAERAFYGAGALASGAINPAIPATLAAGGLLYTKPIQNLLTGSIANRPQSAEAIAELVKKSSPYLTPAFAGLFQ